MDLQHFIDTLPAKFNRRTAVSFIHQYKFPYKTEKVLKALAEHDSLHYLSGQPFTQEGEQCVIYLEKKFQKGFSPIAENYTTLLPQIPCECDTITSELIDETASIIYKFFDDYVDKEMIHGVENEKPYPIFVV